MKHLQLCIIGNMLGRTHGYITTQGQILTDLFTLEGHSVLSASSKINRVLRLMDIVIAIVRNHSRIDVLILEVYSGLYFLVATVASFLGRFFNIPMIFVLRGGNLPDYSRRYPGLTRWVLRRADILVAPSPFLVRDLGHLILFLCVIRNTLDLGKYPFKVRRDVEPRFIWMRAFHPLYNPQMAVRVISSIRKKFPCASLVMAGVDKGIEPDIKKMVNDMGLESAVNFPGFLDRQAKLREFAGADIFLNTNHVDNMPVSVIEACAMGLPVVATCVGGIPDMITSGHNGLLVPDGDANRMADAVISLLENAELAEQISKNGRLLAEQSSWEVVRAEWAELFEELMQKKD